MIYRGPGVLMVFKFGSSLTPSPPFPRVRHDIWFEANVGKYEANIYSLRSK
jgi:hypothetical protein